MNAAAITSAAPAVHQELIRALAERVRVHRLQDQQQRRDQLRRLRGRQLLARSGAGLSPLANHDEPGASADLSVEPWLPYALPGSFGPTDLASPAGLAGLAGPAALAGPAGLAGLDSPVALRTPARPA